MSIRIDGDHSAGDRLTYAAADIPDLDEADFSLAFQFYLLRTFDNGTSNPDNASPSYLFSKGSGLFVVGINGATDGKLRYSAGGTVIGTSNVAPDMWHTCVATSDWGGASFSDELYLDGVSQGTAGGALASNGFDLLLGHGTEVTDGFDGYMGHVCIWDKVLSASEIAAYETDDPRLIASDNLIFYVSMESKTKLVGSINSISQENPGLITTPTDHGLEDGDQIVCADIGGMVSGDLSLNGVALTVTKLYDDSFSIGIDTTGYSSHTLDSGTWLHVNTEAKDSIGGIIPTPTLLVLANSTNLAVRTDDTSGRIDLDNTEHSRAYISGTSDLTWAGGARYGVTASTTKLVDGWVGFSGGTGDVLPLQSTLMTLQTTSLKFSDEHADTKLFHASLRQCSSTDSNASQTFYCRAPRAGKFKIEVDTDSAFGSIDWTATSLSDVDSTTDFSEALTISSLSLSTLYYWRVQWQPTGDSFAVVPDAGGFFTSLANSSVGSTIRFVVGSCSKFDENVIAPYGRSDYDTLISAFDQNLDFWIHLGDTIYADQGFGLGAYPQAQIDDNDARISLKFSEQFEFQRPFKDLLENVPTFFLYDDHEYLNNVDAMHSRVLTLGGNGDVPWGADYSWTNTTGDEYACEKSYALGFGDPGFDGKPTSIFQSDSAWADSIVLLTEGTKGALAAGEWAWGTHDTGYNTIHIRLSDSSDPNDYTGVFGGAGSELLSASPYTRAYSHTYGAIKNWLWSGNPTPYNAPLSPGDSMHYAFDIGPSVTFFAMDSRADRDAVNNDDNINASSAVPSQRLTADADKVLFGTNQLADLTSWLDNNVAKLKILLIPGGISTSSQNIDAFPTRYTAANVVFKEMLLEHKNLVVFAGDVHSNYAARMRTENVTGVHSNDLWEFNAGPFVSAPRSMGLNSNETKNVPNSHRSSSQNNDFEFAYKLCEITYDGERPTLVVKFISQNNDVFYTSNEFAFTARTLKDFVGFRTGGLEEIASYTGNPQVQTGYVRLS